MDEHGLTQAETGSSSFSTGSTSTPKASHYDRGLAELKAIALALRLDRLDIDHTLAHGSDFPNMENKDDAPQTNSCHDR